MRAHTYDLLYNVYNIICGCHCFFRLKEDCIGSLISSPELLPDNFLFFFTSEKNEIKMTPTPPPPQHDLYLFCIRWWWEGGQDLAAVVFAN